MTSPSPGRRDIEARIEAPGRFRRDPEPSSRWRPTHQSRDGLGVWTAGRSRPARTAIKARKRTTTRTKRLATAS
jgi:hypothetical protein